MLKFPKKGKKTGGVANLKRRLDFYFAKFIRLRDSTNWWFKCISCQGVKPVSQMHAGHFQNRRWLSTRYDEENVNGQCIDCNSFNEGNQFEYAKGLDKKYGAGTAEALTIKAHIKSKVDELWYLHQIEIYKKKCKAEKDNG